jgi:glyoxylase-like metal-dependent hydrolase (beta-lactamase superfamily II)
MRPLPLITRFSDGIAAVDAEYIRPLLDAIHVIRRGERVAIVDTGTARSVPYLLAALESLSIAPEDVEYLFITHVHLDHAGGAGQLMQALPRARAVLHPRAAPHLVDPTKIIAASIGVYGEETYRRLYGELLPIDADRIVVTSDGERLEFGGGMFEFAHTPGHALHHQVIVDLDARNIFSGDTFGLSYRQFDVDGRAMILPTTTPTQFDPAQLLASIERIVAYRPHSIFLTHYSRIDDVSRLAASLKWQIAQFVQISEAHADAPDGRALIRQGMAELWLGLAQEHGCSLPQSEILELLAADLDLNTDGLMAWLARRRH